MFNNNKIQVTNYGILSSKVAGDVRIVHLSDLHEKEFGIGNKQLFHAVKKLQPDLIAITGDLVAHEKQRTTNTLYTAALAEGLSKIAPSYFVTGNHERAFHAQVCNTLAEGGVTVLHGDIVTHDIRGTKLNVAGVDDVSYGQTNLPEMANIFSGAEVFNLFLSHRPEVLPYINNKNIDLVLAGHTHAGQIRLPGISRLYMQGQGWFPKYMQGEMNDGNTTMIISRGLGASGYPTLRINNPPDLVFVLIGKA